MVVLVVGIDKFVLMSNIFKLTIGRELIEAQVMFISEFLPNEMFCCGVNITLFIRN